MRRKCALALLAGCMAALPVAANAQVDRPQCNAQMTPADAVFCQGYYALCIKALCHPTAEKDKAECLCNVEEGWSMGPAACTAPGRAQTKRPATGVPIMSTYSNAFNPQEKTLNCSSDATQWAWCYGAPCKVNGPNSATATCLCPVCTGPSSTLGGQCAPANCSKVWSAATPKNDAFANALFYEHLKKMGVDVPPPAKACTNWVATGH